MFFKDDKGIDTIQLGTGDVIISHIKISDDCQGIGFGESGEKKIGKKFIELEGKKDFETNMKLKILFTNSLSIDILIDKLIEAKAILDKSEVKENKDD